MRYNSDSFARLVGAAVKLASPEAEVDTFSAAGHVTLGGGQVFRYEVREMTPEEAAAEAAGWPDEEESSVTRSGPGSGTVRPARLSADLTMSDGRTVHVPVVPPPEKPASNGRISVTIPYPDDAAPGLVASVAVTNADLPMTFRGDIYPYAYVEPGDTLTVPFGEESLNAGDIARVFGEWP